MDFLNWRNNGSEMTLSITIQLGLKGNNAINYMEQDAIDALSQYWMIWNDIISFHSIGNQRKQWYQPSNYMEEDAIDGLPQLEEQLI